MAFKYLFKLRSDASPHIYLHQLKEMMAQDDYLHPLAKNTLLLLKKTRQSFIRLATVKEVVFVPEKFMHFERALEPIITAWSKIEWTEEEKEAVTSNPKTFYSDILKMYTRLGYEIAEKSNMNESSVDEIITATEVKK